MPSKYFENIVSCHLTSVNWLLKHRLYKNRQPVTEDEVSDEESSTHSPHQPQEVKGVQTGPLRNTGLASLDYFHFFIDRILSSLDLASCVGIKHSAHINYESFR